MAAKSAKFELRLLALRSRCSSVRKKLFGWLFGSKKMSGIGGNEEDDSEYNNRNKKFTSQWCSEFDIKYSGFEQSSPHILMKLEELGMKNKLADCDADNLIELLKDIRNEYTATAQEIHSVLLKLNITPEKFSPDTQKLLTTASNFDGVGPFNCPHDIKLEEVRNAYTEFKIKKTIKHLDKYNKEAEEKIAFLTSELQSAKLEGIVVLQEMDERDKFSQFCQLKQRQYMKSVDKLQRNLAGLGVTDVRQCKTVLETYEEIKVVKSKVAALTTKLEKYDKVAPDIAEAEKMLHEAKQEAIQVTQQLKFSIDKNIRN